MKLVFSTEDRVIANIIKNELEVNGIEVVLLDKRDTAYNTFGHIEIYVVEDKIAVAKSHIEKVVEENNSITD